MDTERLDELKRWGKNLSDDGDAAEQRAAGRAILMLTAEVERLKRELASAGTAAPASRPEAATSDVVFDFEADPPQRPRRRRGAAPRRDPEAQPDEAPPTRARARENRGRPAEARRPLPRPPRIVLALPAAGALVVGILFLAVWISTPSVAAAGPSTARVGASSVASLSFSVDGTRARWSVDGRDVTTRARVRNGRSTLRPGRLADGGHVVRASVPGGVLWAKGSASWRFVVDTKPPALGVPAEIEVAARSQPRLRGTLEPEATLTLNGKPVALHDGRFDVRIPLRPATLVARDAAGNSVKRVVTPLLVPRRPPQPVRAVHMTFYAWADDTLRNGVLRLLDEGRINAVELDLKDEAGIVGFASGVPLAKRIGAEQKIMDMGAAIRELHRRGARVIGRVVCFRDSILASAAWKAGERDQVIQTPDGGPYSGYGGFTNFASPAVRRYQIDIAVAGAKLGIDEILYDYVRRPDGPLSSMAFPKLQGTPEASIAGFLGETRRALAKWPNVYLGASVFGVAATRPLEVAQDIPAMARNADYIAPMVYPSHWGPGEYNVANPNAQPYDIVDASLKDFVKQVRGTGARIVPWLQDFTLGVTYGPDEVRAQIRAAHEDGIDDWILWDPNVTYTADALDRNPKIAPVKQAWAAPPKAAGKTATRTQTQTQTQKPAAAAARGAQPNELGRVPVMMFHQIRADGGGEYDLTPGEFRTWLGRFYRDGYVPIRAVDLVDGRIAVPAGKKPIVFTFDDSTKEQLSWGPGRKAKPDTAVGIMLEFAKTHPGWKPAGTFYPNRDPLAGVTEGPEMLRWLNAHGFEIGNHTFDHVPLNGLSDTDVQKQFVEEQRDIRKAIPGAKVRTMALPLGAMPNNPALAASGSWDGESYRNEGIMLVGAEPAPSPFAKSFDPLRIPRIRTAHLPWNGARDFTANMWFDDLERNPQAVFVSDGDPRTISVPAGRLEELAARYRSRARVVGAE